MVKDGEDCHGLQTNKIEKAIFFFKPFNRDTSVTIRYPKSLKFYSVQRLEVKLS